MPTPYEVVIWPILIAVTIALTFEMRELFLLLWYKFQYYLHDPRRPRFTPTNQPPPRSCGPPAGPQPTPWDLPHSQD